MKNLFVLIFTCVILVSKANAGIIFETGTGAFDSTTCCGSFTDKSQFVGTTFSLTEKINIDAIGGHFRNFDSAFGSIFGAIVGLDVSGLPVGSMTSLTNVLAVTTFSPLNATDTFASINVNLEAGHYGLVFGSGLFGANGSSTLTLLQPYQVSNAAGDIIDISNSTSTWRSSHTDSGRYRMFVSGTSIEVPEPGTLGLFLIPFALLLLARRKHA